MNAATVKARLLLPALLVVFGSTPEVFVSAAEPSPVLESQSGSVVSAHLRAVLKRANDAARSKNYDVALMELDAADAMQPKSPFDQHVIDELRAYVKAQTLKQSQ